MVSAIARIPEFGRFLPSRAVGLRVAYRPCSPKNLPRRSRDTGTHTGGYLPLKGHMSFRERMDGKGEERVYDFAGAGAPKTCRLFAYRRLPGLMPFVEISSNFLQKAPPDFISRGFVGRVTRRDGGFRQAIKGFFEGNG